MIIKTLLKSVREFKLATILAPIFMIGEIAFEVSIPTVMARLIDFGIDKGDMDCIVETGILLSVCTVCAVICGSLSGRFSSASKSRKILGMSTKRKPPYAPPTSCRREYGIPASVR